MGTCLVGRELFSPPHVGTLFCVHGQDHPVPSFLLHPHFLPASWGLWSHQEVPSTAAQKLDPNFQLEGTVFMEVRPSWEERAFV